MKITYTEFDKDYSTYSFGYTIHAIREADKLSKMYNAGFLPYSADLTIDEDIYYLARSVRINLADFKLSSENKRVYRKVDAFDFQLAIHEKKDLLKSDPNFKAFALNYAQARFKNGQMDLERLDYILSRSCGTHIFRISKEDRAIGYILVGLDDESLHYWFSFFDTDWMETCPIGKWMMTKAIEWAQDNNRSYIYLGTCYGKHSLYKVRDFKAVEYFSGSEWSADVNELKLKCKSDK